MYGICLWFKCNVDMYLYSVLKEMKFKLRSFTHTKCRDLTHNSLAHQNKLDTNTCTKMIRAKHVFCLTVVCYIFMFYRVIIYNYTPLFRLNERLKVNIHFNEIKWNKFEKDE